MARTSSPGCAPWWSHLAAVCLAALLAASAHAQGITGVLNIRESAGFAVDAIDFAPLGTGNGSFVVDPFTQTGSFATLAGTAGTITDLIGQPVGTPISVSFLTLAAQPTTTVTLTFIEPGIAPSLPCSAPPVAPQICSPAGSGYTFMNVPGRGATGLSSSLSIAFRGTIQRAAVTTPFRATLTSQFPVSYQAALAAMTAGSLNASWSMELVEESVP